MVRTVPILVLATLVTAACDESRPRRAEAPRTDRGDKQALFGDPTLLPTREGERARAEVSMAREIEQAISVLPAAASSRVDVELSRRGVERAPRVIAVVRGQPTAQTEALREQVATIVLAVAGPDADARLVVEPGGSPLPEPTRPPSWMLLMGVLGLGLCAGILVERIRQLRASSRPPTRP
ncbi:MAG: hypothetical protein AB1Z98_26555 [Nannocystaceae bacterium]